MTNKDNLQAAPAGTDFPGKTLGIVGVIVAIFANLIGLIISAIALSQSKKAGYKNTPALAGVIVGAVLLVISIIIFIASIAVGMSAATMTTY
jgi:Co/Zn/Cd efflux system component